MSTGYATSLPDRSVQLSDSRQSATGDYTLRFSLPGSEMLGSIELQFCADSPLFDQPCAVPTGFDISGAALSNQTGETGFTMSSATTANVLVLTRTPATTTAASVSYTLTGVTNPSAAGTFYGRLQTFASADASGAENAHGGLAFSINPALQVTATVPPYLLFCGGAQIDGFDCGTATGNYVNFGNLKSNTTATATTQLLAATNAKSGYAIRVSGTTLTSGNNIIQAMTSTDVSRPGTNQFGMNLAGNSTPSIGSAPVGGGSGKAVSGYNKANFYRFVPGEVVASATTADAYRKYTLSYIVNIAKGQTPGIYVTTLDYVCSATF
ncbi:MAG TPA: hypothetical protein VFL85_02285 [Candidatus Saccharimonadales bacterium]|nr:hypothetical protein [Candidatus Saccharimonadales bacterium]